MIALIAIETPDLDQLAAEIAEDETSNWRGSIKHALKQGARLAAAWAACGNTQAFGKWRKDKLSDCLDQRTAHRYRMLHESFGDQPLEVIERIGLSNCYQLTDPEARQAAVERASEGESLTGKQVSEMIGKSSPKHGGGFLTSEQFSRLTALLEPEPELLDLFKRRRDKLLLNG